jgi:hypothetical protein
MKRVPEQIRQFVADQVSRLIGSPSEVVLTFSADRRSEFAVYDRGRPDSTVIIEWPKPGETGPVVKLTFEGGLHQAMAFCPKIASRVGEFIENFPVPASLALNERRAVIDLTEEPLPFGLRRAA